MKASNFSELKIPFPHPSTQPVNDKQVLLLFFFKKKLEVAMIHKINIPGILN